MVRAGSLIVRVVVLLLLGLGVSSSSRPALATTYLTEREALQKIFPAPAAIEKKTVVLLKQDRATIEKKYGLDITERFFDVYLGTSKGKVTGYAITLNEIGKELPITFMVGITPRGQISAVHIMTFREPRGGEVKNPQFLSQYQDKTLKQPLRVGKDIVAISGATLSSHAISRGTRKALVLIDYFFLHPPHP